MVSNKEENRLALWIADACDKAGDYSTRTPKATMRSLLRQVAKFLRKKFG